MNIFKKIQTVLLVTIISSFIFTACDSSNNQQKTNADSNVVQFTAGTYTGEGEGNFGTIKVEVTFSEETITSIKVLDHNESTGTGDEAFEKLTREILEGQTLSVDTVSGATNSSEGFLNAIKSCVEQSGESIDNMME